MESHGYLLHSPASGPCTTQNKGVLYPPGCDSKAALADSSWAQPSSGAGTVAGLSSGMAPSRPCPWACLNVLTPGEMLCEGDSRGAPCRLQSVCTFTLSHHASHAILQASNELPPSLRSLP